ncbi:MAG: AAA family ATPase [Bacteroidota bacterium]
MTHSPPRVEYLRVQNYRALRDVELKGLTPLTVFLGPNGSGKSTIFDVFAFLSECFTTGLRAAVDARNRFRELRSRGSAGQIVIDLKYRESAQSPLITYHLAIEEQGTRPIIAEEWLAWRRGRQYGRPFRFLDFRGGSGYVISGEQPEERDERVQQQLSSSDLLAVNTLGQLADNPRVNALRRFITGWHLSYLSADSTRGIPEAGPHEHLSPTGDNLPNVIQYLKEEHPETLAAVLQRLAQRVPRLERVDAEVLADGRLMLQVKDAPFQKPVLAKFASDGTLKMMAYLALLHDPDPPELIGVEEPENYLHPRLLRDLAEECRQASIDTQLMVTTHSPFFVNGLNAEEVRVLWRDASGFTRTRQASSMPGIPENMRQGALLGQLWMEGYFDKPDLLTEGN